MKSSSILLLVAVLIDVSRSQLPIYSRCREEILAECARRIPTERYPGYRTYNDRDTRNICCDVSRYKDCLDAGVTRCPELYSWSLQHLADTIRSYGCDRYNPLSDACRWDRACVAVGVVVAIAFGVATLVAIVVGGGCYCCLNRNK